jgi:hypothetical protein
MLLLRPQTGRARALKLYPRIGPCVRCGNPKSERHHSDGNTFNNESGNIIVLCRRCHMTEDGRIEKLKQITLTAQPKASLIASILKMSQTHCGKGHELSGENLRLDRDGHRACVTCDRFRNRENQRIKRGYYDR